MKKIVCFLTLGLLIFGIGMPLLAQVVDTTQISILPVGVSFGFGSLVAISGLTIFITALLNKILKVTIPIWKQIISWGVSIVIVVAANLLSLGFAANLSLLSTLLYGLANGLLSNGVFDLSFIRLLLSFFKINDPPVALAEPPTATLIPIAPTNNKKK
jgi:hypothetical protein